MHKFEYEIGINEFGAPYVDIPEDKKLSMEDKFMVLEMTRMILIGVINDYNKKVAKGKKTFKEKDMKKILETYNTINFMSDEVGLLYKASKEIEDELGDFLKPNKDEE